MKEEVSRELEMSEEANLRFQNKLLTEQCEQYRTEMLRVVDMFRFTLGIAIQARPDIQQLRAMVDIYYKVDKTQNESTQES